jgi:hypothetical protein
VARLPPPTSGLVIGYSYLWEAEFRAGIEEGSKDRPCAIVIATRTEDGDIVVTVAPITHSPPIRAQNAVELPMEVKRRLHLDAERSWVVCSELNRFVWPGPDLRPVSRQRPGDFVYGTLPAPFMRQVFERLAALRAERKPHIVYRPS